MTGPADPQRSFALHLSQLLPLHLGQKMDLIQDLAVAGALGQRTADILVQSCN